MKGAAASGWGRGGPGDAKEFDRRAHKTVERVFEQVRQDGDAALRRLTRRFDGASRLAIEVSAAERRAGARAVDAATRAALRLAAGRIAAFARRQKKSLRPFRHEAKGVVLEQRLVPIDSVGVYAPGGRYPLCSTVLMGAVPARIAGCRRVILCTPPRRDGKVAPEILAAADEAGVDRVFAVGGAQAIAAMAFGTRSVPAVDLIVGPGNKYVAAAKALAAGRAGIDFVAGPSELLIIADRTADPEQAASDLLAQAEHDPEARLWLLALGGGVAGTILRHVRRLARTLPAGSPNQKAVAAALSNMRVRRCASIEEACDLANRVAPEHLSVQTASPRRLVPLLRNYGSLFLGGHSAVAFGDYVTGPNHILPTAGAARTTGGLSVHRFLKVTTVQEVAPSGARLLAPAAGRLARLEGLLAHRLSVELRNRDAGSRAVLFDFNGVLVDDEDFHWRAFREVVQPYGITLSRARYNARYLVFDDRTALATMLKDAGLRDAGLPDAPLPRLLRRKRAAYRRLAAGVRIDDRAARLVRAVSRRVPVAIVSGAARAEVDAALGRAGLGRTFRVIVAAGDVKRPKPAPDGYRLALRRLGLPPGQKCVAVEDSPGGVRAARAAGLAVIGVSTSFPAAALRRAGAVKVVSAIHRLKPADLLFSVSRTPPRRRRS
jgi:histidinol dehydrogenase